MISHLSMPCPHLFHLVIHLSNRLSSCSKKSEGFFNAKALWYQLGFIGSIFGCEISESWGSSRSTLDFKGLTWKKSQVWQSNLWSLGGMDGKLCEAIVSLPSGRWWNDPTSRGFGRVLGHGLQICTQIHMLYSISISYSETNNTGLYHLWSILLKPQAHIS